MNWELLLGAARLGENNKIESSIESESFFRTSFHKDYDRLIFSNSFRRLSRKTQVHPLSKNDHVHNRLTHSLEVASVGRTFGLKAGRVIKSKAKIRVSEYDVAYILQTACLAHDIGNPPFGHAGEEVIKSWFNSNSESDFLKLLTEEQKNDFFRLDGNAQSFRILSSLENNKNSGGMRLTLPVLATVVKYPFDSTGCNEFIGKDKFNYYDSEKDIFRSVFEHLNLISSSGVYMRHPLSYLMEAADDICYGMLDIQDAFEVGIIGVDDVVKVFECVSSKNKRIKSILDSHVDLDVKRLSILVAVSINSIAKEVSDIFEDQFDIICSSSQPKELIGLLPDESPWRELIKRSKKLAVTKIFNDGRKIELELGAYNVLGTLLDILIPAVFELHKKKDISKLEFRNRRAIQMMGKEAPSETESLYSMYRGVIDYIVGMTDNYALHVANQLNGVSD